MWAIAPEYKKVRHFWGNGFISLCNVNEVTQLDYVRGAKIKKCAICQKLLGRKKEVQKQ